MPNHVHGIINKTEYDLSAIQPMGVNVTAGSLGAIRSPEEYSIIQNYIRTNPDRWIEDLLHPDHTEKQDNASPGKF